MISVLPASFEPRRKDSWGSGMPLDTPSKDPKHDFGASERPQVLPKGQLGWLSAFQFSFGCPLNMISVLPVTPKPCRKHNWGSGMPLDTASKDPKHDFGAASHPQGASKGRLGCWNAAECPFEGPST